MSVAGENPPIFARRTGDQWTILKDPRHRLRAREPREILPVLIDAERFAADGYWVAGYVAYEAGIDPAFPKTSDQGTLVALDVFDRVETIPALSSPGPVVAPRWRSACDPSNYADSVTAIRNQIAAGAVYQVNFTYRMHAELEDPWVWFRSVLDGGIPPYATYFDDGEQVVLSLSPERYFVKEGCMIECSPMKGTAPGDGNPALLRESVKDQAENLMITDMIRNDLGRIARVGSVRVPALFTVEQYPTVLQMTSTVTAETNATFARIMAALHPCASITGAPKVAAMGVIADLEDSARGVYCGGIGLLHEDHADWSVAIRTAVARRSDEGWHAFYGVGSGITWDSDPREEWEECQQKCRVLEGPAWSLIETLPADPEAIEWHWDRLCRSASEIGIPLPDGPVIPETDLPALRWVLEQSGRFTVTPFEPIPLPDPLPIALAPGRLTAGDPWRRHKTTRRDVYDRALTDFPETSEVLLGNDQGEWAEFCRGNLLYRLGDRWYTPPVSAGALPGVARARGLANGEWSERPLPVHEIPDEIQLVNSLRGRRRVAISVAPNRPSD